MSRTLLPPAMFDTEGAQEETATVRIEIETSGGFTGRGIGNVTIEDASALEHLIVRALKGGAPPRSRPKNEPAPHSSSRDAVAYSMKVGDRVFTWTDAQPPAPSVLALFDAAWRTRYP
ncbi:MAG: hypothetical protein ACXVJT_00640 [Thermoanaerobaculia bacterium]